MATDNQKKVAKAVAENIRNHKKISISAEMKKAGYADSSCKTPNIITDSKAWPELMDEYWPDDKLAQVGQEGLEATKTISTIAGTKANGGTVDFVDVPDFDARHKFFATITKLKDKIPVVKSDVTSGGEPIQPILGGITKDDFNDSNEKTSETKTED